MNDKSENVEEKDQSKPADEHVGFAFSSMIKIYDPNSQEVYVQARGDN